jgi:hypothetical protein
MLDHVDAAAPRTDAVRRAGVGALCRDRLAELEREQMTSELLDLDALICRQPARKLGPDPREPLAVHSPSSCRNTRNTT